MDAFVLTQLTVPEIRQLFRQELDSFFAAGKLPQSSPALADDSLLTIQEAAEFLHLSVKTVYGKVQSRELPFAKQGKRLYFSKAELTAWVQAGRQKTYAEISAEADAYFLSKNKKG